jgi:hypothetical protein
VGDIDWIIDRDLRIQQGFQCVGELYWGNLGNRSRITDFSFLHPSIDSVSKYTACQAGKAQNNYSQNNQNKQ